MKKKIGLYLGVTPDAGGAFQYSQSMLEAVATLPAAEFESVVAYAYEAWFPYVEKYRLKAIHFKKGFFEEIVESAFRFGLPIISWRKFAPFIHKFTKQFLREKCDLWIFPAQDVWTYATSVPALGIIHDLMHRYERRFPEVSAYGKYSRRERHYKNMCDWVMAVLVDSEVGKQQVHESYGMENARIKILPFIPPKYIYSDQTSAGFDKKYALPEKFIFYPAQFWEHKNHKALIKAVKKLITVVPDMKLVFVGSKKNGYKSALKLVNELKLVAHIIFLGYVPDKDMPELYRRARAMIMPTFFGPTNIPPLEAFVTGCPAAVSDIYGMPEQVGDAALLFNPNSDEEIAWTMQRLWTDNELCAKLSRAGQKQVKRWEQENFNQRLLTILRELLVVA